MRGPPRPPGRHHRRPHREAGHVARPRCPRRRRGRSPPERRVRGRPRGGGEGARPRRGRRDRGPRAPGVRRRRLRHDPVRGVPAGPRVPRGADRPLPRPAAGGRARDPRRERRPGHLRRPRGVGPARRPPSPRAGPGDRLREGSGEAAGRAARAGPGPRRQDARDREGPPARRRLALDPPRSWDRLGGPHPRGAGRVRGGGVGVRRRGGARAAWAGGRLARQRGRGVRDRWARRRQRPLGQEARRAGVRQRGAHRRGSDLREGPAQGGPAGSGPRATDGLRGGLPGIGQGGDGVARLPAGRPHAALDRGRDGPLRRLQGVGDQAGASRAMRARQLPTHGHSAGSPRSTVARTTSGSAFASAIRSPLRSKMPVRKS